MNKLRLTGSLLTRLLGLWLVCASCVQSGYAQQSGGGNYPTGNGVRVKEADGSPNVPGAQVLVFPNGSLTRAGQTVTVTIAGGTTINSTNGQVPYRVNSTTFGDSAFASNALNSTYLSATSGASGAGLTLAVAGGGTNEALTIVPKGSGAVTIGTTTGGVYALGGVATNTTFDTSIGFNMGIIETRSTGQFTFSSSSDARGARDTGLARLSAGVVRVTDGSTGAGQLLIGTSTDTADAQLSVYSQSTTRPSLKLRALSGTALGQNVFESYDASGTLKARIQADGEIAGLALSSQGTTDWRLSSHGGNLLILSNNQYSMKFVGGVGVRLASTDSYGWTDSASVYAGTLDTILVRDGAANTLAQKNGNADQIARSYGANSGYWERGSISEAITLSTSGATTDSTANLLPANAIIEAVTARVTTTITTATDWSLGDATTAARFAAANSTLTSGTTSVGLEHVDQTGAAGPKQTSAAKLRITTTGTPGAGVIRVTVYYRKFVPPTS